MSATRNTRTHLWAIRRTHTETGAVRYLHRLEGYSYFSPNLTRLFPTRDEARAVRRNFNTSVVFGYTYCVVRVLFMVDK